MKTFTDKYEYKFEYKFKYKCNFKNFFRTQLFLQKGEKKNLLLWNHIIKESSKQKLQLFTNENESENKTNFFIFLYIQLVCRKSSFWNIFYSYCVKLLSLMFINTIKSSIDSWKYEKKISCTLAQLAISLRHDSGKKLYFITNYRSVKHNECCCWTLKTTSAQCVLRKTHKRNREE